MGALYTCLHFSPTSLSGCRSGFPLPHADLHSPVTGLSLQKNSQATEERNYFVHTMKKSALWVLSRQIVQQIGEGHIACQSVCPVIEKYHSHTFSIQAISQQTMASRAKLHHKGWIPAASRTEVRHVPPRSAGRASTAVPFSMQQRQERNFFKNNLWIHIPHF